MLQLSLRINSWDVRVDPQPKNCDTYKHGTAGNHTNAYNPEDDVNTSMHMAMVDAREVCPAQATKPTPMRSTLVLWCSHFMQLAAMRSAVTVRRAMRCVVRAVQAHWTEFRWADARPICISRCPTCLHCCSVTRSVTNMLARNVIEGILFAWRG